MVVRRIAITIAFSVATATRFLRRTCRRIARGSPTRCAPTSRNSRNSSARSSPRTTASRRDIKVAALRAGERSVDRGELRIDAHVLRERIARAARPVPLLRHRVGGRRGLARGKPFCADSRYGTAALALARSAGDTETVRAAPRRALEKASVPARVTPGMAPEAEGAAAKQREIIPPERILTPAEFAARLRAAASAKGDSAFVVVQFAVKAARYDPSRAVLEVTVERVPLPLAPPAPADTSPTRPALSCFTRPAFVCGAAGLTFVARDLFRVTPSRAPEPDAPAQRPDDAGAIRDRPPRRRTGTITDAAGPASCKRRARRCPAGSRRESTDRAR